MVEGASASIPFRVQIEIEGSVEENAPFIVQRLVDQLRDLHVTGELAPGATLVEGDVPFGTVESPSEGRGLSIVLQPFPWTDAPPARLEIRFEPGAAGTRLTIELRDWTATLQGVDLRVSDWASAIFLPALLGGLTPSHLRDWYMDTTARRPSGKHAVESYRSPKYHWPSFALLLDRLHLTPSDRLIEVGCGGGAFLHQALESGCSAVGIDHSPEMVRLARAENASAVTQGRLTVFEGDVEKLPAESDTFSVCVCANAFFFFPDPVAALKEMYRALRPGGRLAIVTDTPKARGTPAAPEPFASQSRLYEPDELAKLARTAGFSHVEVEEPDLEHYAISLGLPEKVVAVFQGKGGTVLLTALKTRDEGSP